VAEIESLGRRHMFLENHLDLFFDQRLPHLQAFEVVILDGFADESHGIVFLDPPDTGFPVLKVMQHSPDNGQLPRRNPFIQIHDLGFDTLAAGPLDQGRIDVETSEALRFKDLFEEHSYFAIAAAQIVYGTAAELGRQSVFEHLDLCFDLIANYEIGPEKGIESVLEKVIDSPPPALNPQPAKQSAQTQKSRVGYDHRF
jgi:hypothetical protein